MYAAIVAGVPWKWQVAPQPSGISANDRRTDIEWTFGNLKVHQREIVVFRANDQKANQHGVRTDLGNKGIVSPENHHARKVEEILA